VPTDISLSSTSIDENQSADTAVGTLSTADADSGETYTYSLSCAAPGADDSSFDIPGIV